MRWAVVLLFAAAAVPALAAEPDLARGRQVFGQACAVCHSLEAGKDMTGPSLSGLWGRKAGGLASFPRYSPALRSADVTWDEGTLDPWLRDPAAFIPGNHMTFQGITDDQARADLIRFLAQVTKPGSGAVTAQADQGMGGMMSTAIPNLKSVPPSSQVKAITYCDETYTVTTGDGNTIPFWERNLRFKTDSGPDGPLPDAPAILPAGMMGDRASVIFAAPEEFGEFIKRQC